MQPSISDLIECYPHVVFRANMAAERIAMDPNWRLRDYKICEKIGSAAKQAALVERLHELICYSGVCYGLEHELSKRLDTQSHQELQRVQRFNDEIQKSWIKLIERLTDCGKNVARQIRDDTCARVRLQVGFAYGAGNDGASLRSGRRA